MEGLGKADSPSDFWSPQVAYAVPYRRECVWPAVKSCHHTNYILNILEYDWLVAFCFKKRAALGISRAALFRLHVAVGRREGVCQSPNSAPRLAGRHEVLLVGRGGVDLDRRVDDLVRWQMWLVEVAVVVHVPVDGDLVDDEVVSQDDLAVTQELVAVGSDVLPRLADLHVGLLSDVAHAVGHLLDHDDSLGRHLGLGVSQRRGRLVVEVDRAHGVGQHAQHHEECERACPCDEADELPQQCESVGR